MTKARMGFWDSSRPERAGALVLVSGRIALRLGPELSRSFASGGDVAPLHVDDPVRGSRFLAALTRGVRSARVECALVMGAFQLRGSVDGWVTLRIMPGDFDPDAAWEFLLAANEARLEAPPA